MNLLGHLYFSADDKELMIANLYGDHFHGRNYTHFPEIIQKGIYLHRQIDDFIDHHKEVKALRLALYKSLPKVAGIAIDLFFDHLLAENWANFHKLQLKDYLDQFYGFESDYWDYYPDHFKQFIHQLKTKQWINFYGTNYGLEKSCKGVGSRLSFSNKLNDAPSVYYANEEEIRSIFNAYMLDAQHRFKH